MKELLASIHSWFEWNPGMIAHDFYNLAGNGISSSTQLLVLKSAANILKWKHWALQCTLLMCAFRQRCKCPCGEGGIIDNGIKHPNFVWKRKKASFTGLTSQACILWCPLPPLSQLEVSYCTLHPLKCILRLPVKNCLNIFFKIDFVGCSNYLFMCQDRYKNKHNGKRFCSFSIMY